jgi:predicted AAA+ superfamily ATPase
VVRVLGYLLLDEITEAHGWESWLLRTHELLRGKLFMVVTSSRSMASYERLRGRMLIREMYPLSFREFLKFKGLEIDYNSGTGRLERALEEYLLYGGLPEVVLSEESMDKVRILSSYFDRIVSEVAGAAGEDAALTQMFSKYVVENPRFTASKCHDFLKDLGFRVWKDTVLKLERVSQESYLFFSCALEIHQG